MWSGGPVTGCLKIQCHREVALVVLAALIGSKNGANAVPGCSNHIVPLPVLDRNRSC
jgi:hypothetical protein